MYGACEVWGKAVLWGIGCWVIEGFRGYLGSGVIEVQGAKERGRFFFMAGARKEFYVGKDPGVKGCVWGVYSIGLGCIGVTASGDCV